MRSSVKAYLRTPSLLTALLMAVVILFGTTVSASTYNEAPMLAERVAAGELPPVEERLPKEPFVVGPGVLVVEEDLDWEVGTYGGILHTVHIGAEFTSDIRDMTYEPLLRAPGTDTKDILPNVVSEYTVNEDNTVFTFRLREGLRWSDGHPVTTEDIRFAYEDVLLHPELTPVLPLKYRAKSSPFGEPMRVDIVDDYTFVVTFSEPYGAFLAEIALTGWTGYADAMLKPAHFLKQFHASYTPLDEMRPYLDEHELGDEWWRLYFDKDVTGWQVTFRKAVDFPVLNPWMRVASPPGIIIMERNPYYFKVDTAGNQLPYIDEYHSFEVNDTAMATMRTITGDVDFLIHETSLSEMPLYRQHAEEAGFEVRLLDIHYTPTSFFINYTYPDPTWREVVWDVRFRRALNMALDRDEIIDSVYYGHAFKPTTLPSEYNLAQAHALLDEMGMDKRDAEGMRLAPNGEPFELYIEYAPLLPDLTPVSELLQAHFSELDLRVAVRQISGELRGQKGNANELMATIGWTHAPTWQEGTFRDYLPGWWGAGRLWHEWYNSGGERGEEPPEDFLRIFTLHEEIMAAVPYSPEHLDAVDELRQLYYDLVPIIFPVETASNPVVASTRLGNIPHAGYAHTVKFSGEQIFIREE